MTISPMPHGSAAKPGQDWLTPDGFLWSVGVEDTFIPQPSRVTGRVLDEYQLTDHYRRWRADLAPVAGMGVRAIRYGIPWHRIQPERGRFDWGWTDEVIPYLAEELGIEPIVDLMHYGTPLWLEGQFHHPDYPEHVSRYAAEFTLRYRRWVRFYTPLNEPVINAHLCGRAGYWPPYGRGDRGYVRLLRALVAGMAGTIQAIRSERSDAVIVQVEAAEAIDSAEPHLEASWHRNRAQQFLPTELLTGRVTADHPLVAWLRLNGMGDDELAWFRDQRQTIDIMGVNFYPAVSAYELVPRSRRPQRRRRRGTGRDVEEILASFHTRFGVSVMVTETAGQGTVADRIRWMDESVAAVKRSRERGIPVVGYTWWPLFSMIHWSYRNGKRRRRAYWIPMALYDIVEGADGVLQRERTDAADHYEKVIGSSVERIGDVSSRSAA